MNEPVGNWDDQKPIFRGCAGAKYEHGTKCKRELQRVRVTPGKPRVGSCEYHSTVTSCAGGCGGVPVLLHRGGVQQGGHHSRRGQDRQGHPCSLMEYSCN